jgi:cysteine desulfurase/selenocysteine lyase
MVPATEAVTSSRSSEPRHWDIDAVRADFPMLSRMIRGRPLGYLDSAATALKPQAMIDAVVEYYTRFSANVARGVHTTSQEATERFEAVRVGTAAFLNASLPEEVVFTAGTTASINLIAQSLGRSRLENGDEILVSHLEHHSNLVPWQLVAADVGATIRAIPMLDSGDLDLDWLASAVTERTKFVAVAHVSNVLGTVVPIAQLSQLAHRVGALVVVDGAQGAPHLKIDVQALGCDCYAFSGHKLFGPTGLGVLYARRALLEQMAPWQGGGGMIGSVEIEQSTFAPPPARFEAGTPPIAEVFGLGAVLRYLASWDRVAALQHEDALVEEAITRLSAIDGVRVFGNPSHRTGVIAFDVEGIHPHDVGTALDTVGVAVRAGHHCAQPLMRRLGVVATVRASFAPYNSRRDVDALIEGVEKARAVFGR